MNLVRKAFLVMGIFGLAAGIYFFYLLYKVRQKMNKEG